MAHEPEASPRFTAGTKRLKRHKKAEEEFEHQGSKGSEG
jgi:hypothetical protein